MTLRRGRDEAEARDRPIRHVDGLVDLQCALGDSDERSALADLQRVDAAPDDQAVAGHRARARDRTTARACVHGVVENNCPPEAAVAASPSAARARGVTCRECGSDVGGSAEDVVGDGGSDDDVGGAGVAGGEGGSREGAGVAAHSPTPQHS